MIFRQLVMLAILAFLGGCRSDQKAQEASRFQKAVFTGSRFVDDKKYEVYLPPSYSEANEKRYPVLYMMDGQNLFFDSLAYGGFAWRIDRVLDSLARAEAVEEVIVVGIDNAGVKRFSEYLPGKPVAALPEAYRDSVLTFLEYPVFSDDFLRFVTEELKPLIDEQYRTRADAEHTFIGGSSMGGLISMYAQCEYPDVFGGALCLSTHWPVSLDNTTPEVTDQIVQYFAANLPPDKKWYFDYGTEGLDRYYEPYQQRIDSVLQAAGYVSGQHWITRKFEGHDHNERSWNRRLYLPLEFAFGKE